MEKSESESVSHSVVSHCLQLTRLLPLSMRFSKQEYWSGLPFPSLGDLSDPGIEARCATLQADSLPPEPPGKVTLKWQILYGGPLKM